jgi:hypothetical protein
MWRACIWWLMLYPHMQDSQRMGHGIASLPNPLPLFQPNQPVHGSSSKQRKQLGTPQRRERLDQRMESQPSTRERHNPHMAQRPMPPLPPTSPSGIGQRWMRMNETMGEEGYSSISKPSRFSGFKSDHMLPKSKGNSASRSHLVTPTSSFGSMSKVSRRKS